MKFLGYILVFIFCLPVVAQETINQFDANGKRHGIWKKTYEGLDQLRYEGEFDHGKEVGVFKHYKPKSGKNPTAILTYSANSVLVEAEYYTSKGKLISKGQLKDRKRIGEWTYYHKDSDVILMRENYKNDILDGLKITYFENGKTTDKITYKNGERHGDYKLYSLKGVLLQQLKYDKDELHGEAIYYNGKGEKVAEGMYTRDRKNGYWKYYEDGKLKEEKFFDPENIPTKG